MFLFVILKGRDASRAYITGDFSEAGLIDDLQGLDDSSLSSIEDWLSFYREEYKTVGMFCLHVYCHSFQFFFIIFIHNVIIYKMYTLFDG